MRMTTISRIANEIAKRQKKTDKATIANLKVVLNLLGDLCFEDAATTINTVYSNGLKRSKK